ncbi:hypothetical protein Cgig2_025364 [Carnegiea gigantea]|uniref:Uncharacterized protein n=1 Tax=Carnegiea gigantea TaxID=171969 RepID=A0A9Q1JLD0_9CARY|nr:hypothetical protein Cgig2_025364 [Carnegiea gigantea]
MAATDSQKQLLTLIRDFAAEKSQGERRVFNLKKRIEELRSELEAANSDLENGKCIKETAEQELYGYEVQLSISEASIQTLEEFAFLNVQQRICLTTSSGDILHSVAHESNIDSLRTFYLTDAEAQDLNFPAKHIHPRGEDAEFVDLEKKISAIVAQTAAEERECETEQNLHNQLHQELDDSKRRKELIEGIAKDVKELQDLTRYPDKFSFRLYFYSSNHWLHLHEIIKDGN